MERLHVMYRQNKKTRRALASCESKRKIHGEITRHAWVGGARGDGEITRSVLVKQGEFIRYGRVKLGEMGRFCTLGR